MTDHQSIVDELKAYYRALEGEEMQDGDLTVQELSARLGSSTSKWRERLKAGKVPPGYKGMQVVNPFNGQKMWVLRKITQV